MLEGRRYIYSAWPGGSRSPKLPYFPKTEYIITYIYASTKAKRRTDIIFLASRRTRQMN